MSLTDAIRMKGVKRNKKYNDMVDLLWVRGKGPESSKVFSDIKDIIVLAAMIGKKYEVREKVGSENTPIALQTFAGTGSGKESRVHQHNIVFMFSLMLNKDMNAIRDENIDATINEFEEYSNGGLSIMQDWMAASASNPMCILDKMVEIVGTTKPGGLDVVENPF
jgi:dnd system-associated protein 4